MTDSPADAEGPMFERTPALGAIAAVAALGDLVFQRFVLRSLGEVVPHSTLVEIARWAPLARNVAAICGTVALAISLFGFVREPRVARVGHRLGLAAFAGVFMPTVVLATVLPADRTTPQVVLFASAAACVLGVLVAMTALRRPAPRGLRAGLMLVAFSAFAALLTLVLALALPPSLGEVAVITRQTVMRAGEAAFLLAPVAIGATTVLGELSPRAIVAAAAGVVTTIAATIGLAFVRAAVDGELGVLLYGAQHLEMLSDVAPAAYVARADVH
jgi:hypothetical protein